ncbi:metallophosphoesterase family protein [Paenibacillus sp. YN15]|uniref:metallophosphoesterase family protein n=1 Tax=Paenibacillus sp. YN15 TaxID=1742774 RepID=UPI000DCD52DE|nr:metallophosphoesterase [Paenibacillus sp. YN15]RAV05695.1 YfcE family phosphodiesterase [Paenibacillus sp. YN15]
MKIGVVSDTHLSDRREIRLPQELLGGLSGVELILHAGDWISPRVAEELEKLAPVEGIAGNNDGMDIVSRFGYKKIVEAAGVRIGLIHGDGYGKTTERRAFDAFEGQDVQAIVFGHSHIPYLERKAGILLFNPGSPTDKRRQLLYSYGIMEIREGEITAVHHYYASWD